MLDQRLPYHDMLFAISYDRRQLLFDKAIKGPLIHWASRAILTHSDLSNKQPNIVDFGTGTGRVIQEFTQAFPGAQIVGTDGCLPMLSIASNKQFGINHSITPRFVQATHEYPPFPDESFDIATACLSTSYTNNPAGILRSIAQVVKIGGYIGWIDAIEASTGFPFLDEKIAGANSFYGDTKESLRAITILHHALIGNLSCEQALRQPYQVENDVLVLYMDNMPTTRLKLIDTENSMRSNLGFFGMVLQRLPDRQ